MPYLLALVVYLWAGLWMAWPCLSPTNIKGKPLWVSVAAFIVSMAVWAVVFPIHAIGAEKARANNAARNALFNAILADGDAEEENEQHHA